MNKKCPRCKHEFDVLAQKPSGTFVTCSECGLIFDYNEFTGFKKVTVGIAMGILFLIVLLTLCFFLSTGLTELLHQLTGKAQ